MTKLSFINLSKAYDAVKAVDNVSMEIQNGEFLSLLGPSGCGKTTTLRMIAGFISPTSGTIEVDGKVFSSPSRTVPPERRGMSMIFQSYAIWPNMTVAQNVAFGLEVKRLTRADIEVKVSKVLDTVRLSKMRDRYPSELSGGQQQRVAMARAIVVNPSVLLLDEPLSNLDANLREEMLYEIKRLHQEFGFTTVYVTHDQSEAMSVSDRIAVFESGRIAQIAKPIDVYCKPKTRFVANFIGVSNDLEGTREGDIIRFDGFQSQAPSGCNVSAGERCCFSVRPESFHISKELGAESPKPGAFEGMVVSRAFMGSTWDYRIKPVKGEVSLKISAPAREILDVDQKVMVRLDPDHLVALDDSSPAAS